MEMIKTRQESVEEHIVSENKNENAQNKEKESNKEANTENIIKVKAWLEKIVYPKPPKVLGENDDTWGVTHWAVREVLMGEPVESRYGTIIITGEFYGQIHEGQMYTLLAKETETSYGIQYQLMYYKEDTDFKKVQNQRAFLKTFLTQGQIEEMFKVLDDPLDSIANHDEEALMQVKGIGPYISKRIIERFEENKDMSEVYIELDKYGVTPDLIGKLVRFYKAPQKIIQVIKENPYQLTFDIDGIGFVKADKIALNGGIGEKSYKRIAAWINWFLEEQGNQGHSYITASELLSSLFYAFDGRENIEEIRYNEDGKPVGSNIGEAMNYLQEKGVISVEEREDGNKSRRRVYLTKYWQLEKDIADNLKRLLRAENRFNYANWEEKIEALEARQGFPFADEQKKGILLGLQSQVCFISGSAGVGKSTLVAGILEVLKDYSFVQTALSGRAAANLQEITGQEGLTIHRLLAYNPMTGFEYNENNRLPYDIIILDETSLVGGEIFLDLVKAIETGSKLVCLGDESQLEAIGALNLAADMIKSDIIPTVQLTQIHRQAARSGIINVATDVRNQIQLYDEQNYEGVEIRGELQDIELDIRIDKDDLLDRVVNSFMKMYNSPLVNKNIMDIQCIVPVKERGQLCTYEINKAVQAEINPVNENDGSPKVKVKINKDKYYYMTIGDKIMCVKNNYKTLSLDGATTPIFNGWPGIIKDIDENYVYVDFPMAHGITLIERKEAANQLMLSYACTTHKYQGSSCKVIIGALDYSTPPSMLTFQQLYTLITRSKKYCVLVAQNGALRKAIATDFVSTKRTFLPELLEND